MPGLPGHQRHRGGFAGAGLAAVLLDAGRRCGRHRLRLQPQCLVARPPAWRSSIEAARSRGS
eukprot:10921374-Lingulodinium_polyedra.AAC.1